MTSMLRCAALGLLALSSIGFLGCSASLKEVRMGVVATPDVVITAEDNSFRIETGVPFQPPFQNHVWKHRLNLGRTNVSTLFDEARRNLGARKVLIDYPGVKGRLYGLILFNAIHPRGYGVGSNAYKIEIPWKFVEKAFGGNVSAVYEVYSHPAAEYQFKSWVLWISDVPIF